MTTTSTTPIASLLVELSTRLSGTVALPGEPGYELATPWNVAVPVNPAAVVSAADATDVSETLLFAAAHGLTVAVQRTGHGATSLGPDAVLLHTGRLQELSVDPATRTARIGAGHVWQDVIEAAAPYGLAPLVGSAPGVGVVGFLTGGGIGPMVRTFGVSADHVRSFDVVTGDGRRLRASADENTDLFWGLRGGKSTLGIVTAVEIDLLPIAEFYGGALYFDGADAATVLHAWREWGRDLPEHASTSVALLQLPPLPMVPPPLAGRLTVAVRYASVADPAEAEAVFAPMRAAATPILDGIAVMPYAAIGAVHADPVDPMPTYEESALLKELPAEAIDVLLAQAGPGSGSPQVIVELRQLGGAYARAGAHPSAFSHRDAAFNLMVIGVLAPPVADIVPAHAAGVAAALAPWATGGVLPNFSPSADPAVTTARYDEDTAAQLGALAAHYDPAGVLKVGPVVARPE